MTNEMNMLEEATLEELKEMNNQRITSLEYDLLSYNTNVIDIQCLGQSSSNLDCTWYSVALADETEIDVFLINDNDEEETEMENNNITREEMKWINKGYYLEKYDITIDTVLWMDIYTAYRIAALQEVFFDNFEVTLEEATEMAEDAIYQMDKYDIGEEQAIANAERCFMLKRREM